jgi:TPP-dependent pyruvate/acetoin dehydrogenase alpha subunit
MTMASSTAASPVDAATPHNGFSLISNEKLLALYSTMLKCRMLQTRIRTVAKENESTAQLAAIGGEAPAAGLCIDLLPGDTLAPGLLGFGPSFVKGLPADVILSTFSPVGSRLRFRYATLNLIPPSLNLAAQLERALAAAKANKSGRNKKLVVAFCGEASAAPDLLHEVMREAGKRKLPMLLMCSNDPDADEVCTKAKDFGFPGITVDGADAVAVYRAATESMAHARRGSGPTLIECKPWVLPGQKAAARRAAADSVLRMEEYLIRKGLFDKKFKSKIAANFRREIATAMMMAGKQPS